MAESSRHGTAAQPLRLPDHHQLILRALDEVEARHTGIVAEGLGLAAGRRGVASANCRQWLLEMQAAGWVERLDGCDPVEWRRTPAGTAMMGLLR